MVRVQGHWRSTGWVRTHIRHPLRPEDGQVGLVLLVGSPVRLDPGRYHPGGVAPSCPLTDGPVARPAELPPVPEPRGPADAPSPGAGIGPRRPG